MNKQEIERDMSSTFKGARLLNIAQIAVYIGCNRDTVSKIMLGTEYLPVGRQRKYTVKDIANVIVERKIS